MLDCVTTTLTEQETGSERLWGEAGGDGDGGGGGACEGGGGRHYTTEGANYEGKTKGEEKNPQTPLFA